MDALYEQNMGNFDKISEYLSLYFRHGWPMLWIWVSTTCWPTSASWWIGLHEDCRLRRQQQVESRCGTVFPQCHMQHQAQACARYSAISSMIHSLQALHMVTHQVSDLGWVDFDFDIPLILPARLLCPFCLSVISPSRIRQTVKQPKSKSIQPRSETYWITLPRSREVRTNYGAVFTISFRLQNSLRIQSLHVDTARLLVTSTEETFHGTPQTETGPNMELSSQATL